MRYVLLSLVIFLSGCEQQFPRTTEFNTTSWKHACLSSLTNCKGDVYYSEGHAYLITDASWPDDGKRIEHSLTNSPIARIYEVIPYDPKGTAWEEALLEALHL